jgi:hypothetical protein
LRVNPVTPTISGCLEAAQAAEGEDAPVVRCRKNPGRGREPC